MIAVGPTNSASCFAPMNAHEAFVLAPRKWRIKRLEFLGQVIWNLQVTHSTPTCSLPRVESTVQSLTDTLLLVGKCRLRYDSQKMTPIRLKVGSFRRELSSCATSTRLKTPDLRNCFNASFALRGSSLVRQSTIIF